MARALLVTATMMKHLVSSLLVVATVGALAVADTPKPAAPPSMSQQPLQMRLTVKAGADTRTHELAIFDTGCDRVEEKASNFEDEINVCTRPAPTGIFVEVNWRTRNGASEYRTSSGTLLPRKGGTFEVGRIGGTRFTLQMQ